MASAWGRCLSYNADATGNDLLMIAPAEMNFSLCQTLGLFGLPMGGEWIILLILGLLIFGRRLPEVGRSLGRGIVEFKKGIRGIEEEVEDETSRPTKRISENPAQELPRAKSADETEKEFASADKSNRSD